MTDIVLNQLYPGGVMKQLGDAAGGVVYDQYAPGGPPEQLRDAAGLDDPLDQYAPGGPAHQIELELESGGGGNGAPEWVPEGAKIHIDLVGGSPQGRAWVQGTGVVAVDTLLGNDPNADNDIGSPSVYDPAQMNADGYDTTVPFAFIGAARTLLLDAATASVKFKQFGVDNTAFINVVLVSADDNDAIEFKTRTFTLKFATSSYNGDLFNQTDTVLNIEDGSINSIAMTITPTRSDIALNGSAAVAGALAEEDRPAGNLLVAAYLGSSHVEEEAFIRTQSITLYDPLPSTTGLSELSEVS